MISRLTATAACFAILASASLALAADLGQPTSVKPTKVIQLERVEITAKRLPQAVL
jgi:hypothetical protein